MHDNEGKGPEGNRRVFLGGTMLYVATSVAGLLPRSASATPAVPSVSLPAAVPVNMDGVLSVMSLERFAVLMADAVALKYPRDLVMTHAAMAAAGLGMARADGPVHGLTDRLLTVMDTLDMDEVLRFATTRHVSSSTDGPYVAYLLGGITGCPPLSHGMGMKDLPMTFMVQVTVMSWGARKYARLLAYADRSGLAEEFARGELPWERLRSECRDGTGGHRLA